MLTKQRRITAFLWYGQVDAAAFVEAEVKLGDGGGAQGQRCREEEDEVKEMKGKKEKDPWSYL